MLGILTLISVLKFPIWILVFPCGFDNRMYVSVSYSQSLVFFFKGPPN